MINTGYFKGKKVLIAGLARSGVACANLLYDLGADVSVTDNKDDSSIRLNASKLKSGNIRLEAGKHTKEFVQGKDIVVISPGVPKEAQPVVWAGELNIPVISEIEVAWFLCPAEIIAVTGSSGKTTVTTLIGRILEADGKRAFVCGNIGNPFCGEVEKMRQGDFVSLEVSSFQLEAIRDFRPKISVILNFTSNHLDRHKDMQEYLDAKKRIFMNQKETDYLVLNSEDPVVGKIGEETRAKRVYFSQNEGLNPNQCAVLAAGSILGIGKDKMLSVFREFKGIEHRMEFFAEFNNVKFINDSKATTADSALWALRNIPGKVILIAGGKHKGVDYGIISGLARGKLRNLILIGEARKKIADALKDVAPAEEAPTLQEAVFKAYLKALPGDCVLLSPMCSSFDMFSSYEERGKVFKQAVYDLMSNDKAQNSK